MEAELARFQMLSFKADKAFLEALLLRIGSDDFLDFLYATDPVLDKEGADYVNEIINLSIKEWTL